ncbi:MAG: aspartate aminotransferase family protein [Dehalococcoidia bacterium]
MVTNIEKKYFELHPGSAERHDKARNIFPDGVTHDGRRLDPFQIYATKGSGAYKWDVDGNKLIDYWTGHGSMILGHSHPEIVSAIQNQIELGTHLSANSDLEIEWGSLVKKLIPSAEKVRFHSSGTEATMMAIRMARAYTQKTKIIKFNGHFHGWSDYLSAGATDGMGGIPQETLNTMIVIEPGNIDLVTHALESNKDVAGIIVEPTGAHMGLEPISTTFLQKLRDAADKFGIVLIFDEVVTGFRVSRGGAQARFGITPDLTTLAKILGGGLPGGAVAGKSEIINMIESSSDPNFNRNNRIGHNGTFNANPLSAAAGVTALNLIDSTNINAIAEERAVELTKGLNDVLTRMEIPGCVTNLSSLAFLRIGINESVADPDQNPNSAQQNRSLGTGDISKQLNLALINNGIHATSTRFILSAAHTQDDIKTTIQAVEQSLIDVRNQGLV